MQLANINSNIRFSVLRAVEPSLEHRLFGATSSSRTRVLAAHHDPWNFTVLWSGDRSDPCRMTLNSRPLALYPSYTHHHRCNDMDQSNQPIPPHGYFLLHAESLINQNIFDISVVCCHMACEAIAEQAFTAAFRARGVADIEEAVLDLLNGYNLANDRNRKLYVALSGDFIQEQLFWPAFKASALRRNAIVHQGKAATKAEALESFNATSAFISHIRKTWSIA